MTYPSSPGGPEQRPGDWTDSTWSAPAPRQPDPTLPFDAPGAAQQSNAPVTADPTLAADPMAAVDPTHQLPPTQPNQPYGPAGSAYGAPVPPPPAYQSPQFSGPAPVQPGYPYGYPPVAPQRPQNSLAMASMILALVGIATCITAPIGAILGHVALRQIRERGESGEGMAKTGIIVGWVLTGLLLLVIVGYAVAIIFAIKHGVSSSSDYDY